MNTLYLFQSTSNHFFISEQREKSDIEILAIRFYTITSECTIKASYLALIDDSSNQQKIKDFLYQKVIRRVETEFRCTIFWEKKS